jgi:hypothetical protein
MKTSEKPLDYGWSIHSLARGNPCSVTSGETITGRLLETLPGSALIFFVTSLKQVDFPGFEPYVTEQG